MSLHPECLAEFKLNKPPFDSLPSEDFVYSDPELESLVESAAASLAAPNTILTLTGDSGSGRSLQLMRLLGLLPAETELIAFRARPNTTFEAVDFTIRTYLRKRSLDDLNQPLTGLLATLVRSGFDPVIAIDDAHQLGTDIIDLLLRMRTEIMNFTGHGLRLVLVGDSGPLRRRLRLEAHDEKSLVRVQIRPFSLRQTGAYLQHRLRAAGMADSSGLITDTVVSDLHAESGGLPEPLNQRANEWLEKVCHLRRRRAATMANDEPDPITAPARSDTRNAQPTPAPLEIGGGSRKPLSAAVSGGAAAFAADAESGTALSTAPKHPDAEQQEPAKSIAAALAAKWAASSASAAASEPSSSLGLRAEPEERIRSGSAVADPGQYPGDQYPADQYPADQYPGDHYPGDHYKKGNASPAHGVSAGPEYDDQDDREDHRESAAVPLWNQRWFVPAVALVVAALILSPMLPKLWERPAPTPASFELPLPHTPPAPTTTTAMAPTGPAAQPAGDPGADDWDPDLQEILFDPRPVAEAPIETEAPPAAVAPPSAAVQRTPDQRPTPSPAPTTPAQPAPAPAPVQPAPAPAQPAPAPTQTAPIAPPAPRTEVRPPPDPVVTPAPTPAPAVVEAPAPRVETTRIAEDLSWLRRQNARNYTIQLLAAPDFAAAQRYVEQHRLTGIRYIETRSGGREFVVAIAGSFSQRATAEAAREELPEAVKADHPWVRSIGSLLGVLR